MNLVLLRQRAQRVVLSPDDRRTQHILKVLRRKPALPASAASPGSTQTADAPIAVGVVGGAIGSAVLRSVARDGSITLECAWPAVDACSTSGTDSLPLDVLVGLARPETCKKVLRELATLGARSITFVLSELCDRSYASSKLWRDGEWEHHLQRGAEQAFRTTLPTVHHCSSLSRALRGLGGATPLMARSDPRPIHVPTVVPLRFSDSEGCGWLPRTRLLCHDDGDGTTPSIFAIPLPSPELTVKEGIALACGPERGWTDAEKMMMQRASFATTHLGPQIFRTEMAVAVGSTIVAGRCGWLEDGFIERRSRLLQRANHPLGCN